MGSCRARENLAFLAWGDFHARSSFAGSQSLRKKGDYS